MNLNLNLGAGALDIPIARKLDISGAPERPLQAPARPAQAPGPARPGAWFVPGTNQPRQPGGPVQASLGPLRAMRQSSLDRRHDGTTGVRMERWRSGWSGGRARWDDGIIIGPRQPRRPVRLPIRPSGPAQWRGAADAQLRRLAGPQNRILTRNTRPAKFSVMLNLHGCPSCAPAAHAPPGGPGDL